MTEYRLTDVQKDLLEKIVENHKSRKIKGPIIPVRTFGDGGGALIGLDGYNYSGYDIESDLEALRDFGFLIGRYNSQGKMIFTLHQLGIDAVENNYKFPDEKPNIQNIIGAIVNTVSGGTVQAVGYAENSEINQKFETKADFDNEIDTIVAQITTVIKGELTSELLPYLKELEQFQIELKSEKPDESKLKSFLNTLSFMGNIEGSISLIYRVWPYLVLLLNMVMNVTK